MKADLHSHTTYSDGVLSVDEIINLAISLGLDYLSITDHDCLDGSIEAIKLTKNRPLKIIPGIELSTFHNNENIHILGYFKSNFDANFLENFLETQRVMRLERARKIIKKLHDLGIVVNPSKLDKIKSITRGSIAQLIVESGYYYSKQEIFDKFLGDGAPAYLPSTDLPTEEGIKLLKSAGAITVLAHPVNIKNTPILDFIEMGVDGIEAIYPINSEADTHKFLELARNHNLIVTGGSDFHRFNDYKHGHLGSSVLKDKQLVRFLNTLDER